MTERTRQTILGVFLAGVLVVTVGSAELFSKHRQKQVTALGVTIQSERLGFKISMPKGWERVSVNMNLLGASLAYMRELEPHAGRDSLTDQSSYRYIYFLITPPQASSEDILKPLLNLVRVLDISDNYFGGYQITWTTEPTRPGKYQRHKGNIRARVYKGRLLPYAIELGLYEQITADQQVFWCVIFGNTPLNAADEALLEAVVGSFSKITEQANGRGISTAKGSIQGG